MLRHGGFCTWASTADTRSGLGGWHRGSGSVAMRRKLQLAGPQELTKGFLDLPEVQRLPWSNGPTRGCHGPMEERGRGLGEVGAEVRYQLEDVIFVPCARSQRAAVFTGLALSADAEVQSEVPPFGQVMDWAEMAVGLQTHVRQDSGRNLHSFLFPCGR